VNTGKTQPGYFITAREIHIDQSAGERNRLQVLKVRPGNSVWGGWGKVGVRLLQTGKGGGFKQTPALGAGGLNKMKEGGKNVFSPKGVIGGGRSVSNIRKEGEKLRNRKRGKRRRKEDKEKRARRGGVREGKLMLLSLGRKRRYIGFGDNKQKDRKKKGRAKRGDRSKGSTGTAIRHRPPFLALYKKAILTCQGKKREK